MLDFSFSRQVPLILQTEAAECGHACVAMVASYHGHRIDLPTLRERHSVSLKGSTLADLMQLSAGLGWHRAQCSWNCSSSASFGCRASCIGISTISSFSAACAQAR
jgi:ABC-type bacteriocin/lantibiotic exporter with double-glycine peptidase domain